MTNDGLDELRELYQSLLAASPVKRLELLEAARERWRVQGVVQAVQALQAAS